MLDHHYCSHPKPSSMHDNVSAGERVTASMRISRIPYLFPSPLLSSALTPPLSLPSFLVSFLSPPSYPLCSFLSYLVSPLSFSFLSILFFPVPYPILYRLFILLVSSRLSNPSFRLYTSLFIFLLLLFLSPILSPVSFLSPPIVYFLLSSFPFLSLFPTLSSPFSLLSLSFPILILLLFCSRYFLQVAKDITS